MQPIAQILPKVLTETLAPSTPARPTSTELNDRKQRWQFQTFNDPQLERLLEEATMFSRDLLWNENPRWLSIIGSCGTGKTYVSKNLFLEAIHNRGACQHATLKCGALRRYWPDLLSRIRNREYHEVDDAIAANFLMLDELGAERDPTGFAAEQLSRLLNNRLGKWTVITSNSTLQQIASVDARVASRIQRPPNQWLEIETTDFALR